MYGVRKHLNNFESLSVMKSLVHFSTGAIRSKRPGSSHRDGYDRDDRVLLKAPGRSTSVRASSDDFWLTTLARTAGPRCAPHSGRSAPSVAVLASSGRGRPAGPFQPHPVACFTKRSYVMVPDEQGETPHLPARAPACSSTLADAHGFAVRSGELRSPAARGFHGRALARFLFVEPASRATVLRPGARGERGRANPRDLGKGRGAATLDGPCSWRNRRASAPDPARTT
jgi:hypothetical protein